MFIFADCLDDIMRDSLYAIVVGYFVDDIKHVISDIYLVKLCVKSGYNNLLDAALSAGAYGYLDTLKFLVECRLE
jgi:hypothetical protein